MRRLFYGLLAVTALFHGHLRAGGGPFQTLVVVNDNETQSLKIGRYYAEIRGIPDAQILHLNLPDEATITESAYGGTVLVPILNYLSNRGLSGQISTFVFTFRRPYKVRTSGRENGLSSVFYYGFKNYELDPICNLEASGLNAYAGTETAFEPANGFGYRLAAFLTLDNFAEVQTVIDRSLAADFSMPVGTAHFLLTSDVLRNVRWPQFDEAQFMSRLVQPGIEQQFGFGNFIQNQSNVVAYLTGKTIPEQIDSNTYVPGALADHLTSFGGLLDPFGSQMSIKEWLRAGCAGSYGTIVEPCNFTNKFPAAATHYYYARGFSLGESYYQGLSHPYQGIVLGDPLCRPFAVPLAVGVSGVNTNLAVSGDLNMDFSAASADTNRWVDRMEVYVDGFLFDTVTNVVPTAGNLVQATVDGTTRSYTIQADDTREDIAAGLAAALDQPPGLGVDTDPVSDRIVLIQEALGVPGAIPYSANTMTGTAARLTVHVKTGAATVVETIARARQSLVVEGMPTFGHSLSAAIKRLDGSTFTHTINSVLLETRVEMVDRLMDAINNDTNLQVPGGCTARARVNVDSEDLTEFQLFANTNTWEGANLEVNFDVTGFGFVNTDYNGKLRSNAGQMAARGLLTVTSGQPVLNANYTLDTTDLADGPHTVSVVAYEGTSVRTQGATNFPIRVDNHDVTCEITWPPVGKTFIRHQTVNAQLVATTPVGSITALQLFVEGKPQGSHGFETGVYPPGPLILHAEARNSANETVRSDPVRIVLLENEDADGLADDWEIFHFGDITSWAGTNDVDNDGFNNDYEFITDTDPNDPLDFFSLAIGLEAATPLIDLIFPTSTQRLYQVEYNDSSRLDANSWNELLPAPFTGSGAVTNIFEPPLAPLRRYRARISLP